MLITKTVMVTLGNMNIKHFENLGYDIPRKDNGYYEITVPRGIKIEVKVEDLLPNAKAEVQCLCDYCLAEGIETMITKAYVTYNDHRKNIQKDCCNNVECMKKKREEVNLKLYGKGNQFQREEVKERMMETCLKKYGGTHPSKNPEILNKQLIGLKKALYKNGTGASSIQQRYIHFLIGGELNYPVNRLMLDIAFPNDMIYVEYNGGGHYLDVTWRGMDIKDFEHKERKRELFLKKLGWKEILFISSENDLLPSPIEIKELINEGITYLKSGHTYFEINIDKLHIKCKEYTRKLSFNNLIGGNKLKNIFNDTKESIKN